MTSNRAEIRARWTPSWTFATWFGCGYSPVAPGTAGTLGAIAIAWPMVRGAGFGSVHFALLSALLLYPAIRCAGIVAAESGRKDPQIVVIDEVLGLWTTLVGAARFDGIDFLLAFLFFRLFDIWKPPPIRLIEKIQGGAGIVLDDILAGVYAAALLFAVDRLRR